MRFGLFVTFSSDIKDIFLKNCDPNRYPDELDIQMEENILVVSPQDASGILRRISMMRIKVHRWGQMMPGRQARPLQSIRD